MKRSIQIELYGFDAFKKKLPLVKAAGFDCIDIYLSTGSCCENNFRDHITEVREAIEEVGLYCATTHLTMYDPLISSEKKDDKVEAAIRHAVSATALLGAEVAAFHARTSISTGYDWRISYQENREALLPLVDLAVKENVKIAVENIPIFPDCPIHRFYTSDPDDICELVDSFDTPHVGVCWDTGHANLMSFDQPKVIRQMGHRLIATHLSSNFKEQDWHLPPVFGYIDWAKIMAAFADIGYAGTLNLEVGYSRIPESTLGSFFRLCYDSAVYLEELFEKRKSELQR